MAKAHFHAFIIGEVQMVGYRAFAAERASSLRITGWVRNNPDGQVEIRAEGEELDLRTFLDCLRQGPRAARVTEVQVAWAPPEGKFAHFMVR